MRDKESELFFYKDEGRKKRWWNGIGQVVPKIIIITTTMCVCYFSCLAWFRKVLVPWILPFRWSVWEVLDLISSRIRLSARGSSQSASAASLGDVIRRSLENKLTQTGVWRLYG
jgi:hypothetical protein